MDALDMEGKTYAYSQYTDYLQSDAVSRKMAGWTDIVDIVLGPDLTVVLHRDGTVVAGKMPNDVAFPDLTAMKDLYVPAVVTDGL